MSLWGYSDDLLCRTFPTTLTGKALTWFSHLESNSIKNFGMMSNVFFEQYKINLGSKKGSSHLFLLHREPGESLSDFNIRFRQEVSEVGKVDESFAIEAYKNALDYDEFGIYNSLTVQPVGSLGELYDRSDRYAKAEKEKKAKLSRTTKRPMVEGMTKPKQQFEGNTKNKIHEGSTRKVRNEEESRKPQEKQKVRFPKLNIGLGELFKKIKDLLPIPEPLPVETRDKRDNNKYCAHQKDHGHNTDTCRALAAEVQNMIEEGKLQQYVKKNPTQVNTLANTLDLREIRVDYASLIGTETLEEGKTEISFSNADIAGVYQPHNDAIVILALIGMYKVRRVLVDTGSSISVIFSGAYSSMSFSESQVEADDNPIIGFSGETMTAMGRINLPTMVGGRTVMQYFSLLDCRAPYNAILGRDWIHSMEVVTSTVHQCLKFITPAGVMKVRSDQVAPHKCHERAMEEYRKSELKGSEILQNSKDVFTWSLGDIPGIDPDIACHRLNISEGFKPVRQNPLKMAPERKAKVAEEIDRMLEARIIRPVKYPKWLANIVAVPKKNGKIRICIDFTNLNKACPSDPYPMPRIIELVDAT
ncbi:uncharacterized protein LOC113279374 [Papaver somniferum]|uniref:uncharacterized protein LOC113279374 n=1 Tax=Papaver somniferum TaxID=3469 RepID=UPI000E6FA5E1|nr:uncharacterized protein LOC113279374 [Papaver somniferum]